MKNFILLSFMCAGLGAFAQGKQPVDLSFKLDGGLGSTRFSQNLVSDKPISVQIRDGIVTADFETKTGHDRIIRPLVSGKTLPGDECTAIVNAEAETTDDGEVQIELVIKNPDPKCDKQDVIASLQIFAFDIKNHRPTASSVTNAVEIKK